MFIFGFLKMIIIGFIALVVILGVSICNGWTLPKDEMINAYDTFLQSFDTEGLSKDKQLKGKRVFGTDKYIGTYQAEYKNTTSEESIFGGTLLHRKNGDHIKLKINVEKESGSINVINKLGNNEISLIKENGEYEDTVYIDGMSYYLIVKLENFNGKINIISDEQVLATQAEQVQSKSNNIDNIPEIGKLIIKEGMKNNGLYVQLNAG